MGEGPQHGVPGPSWAAVPEPRWGQPWEGRGLPLSCALPWVPGLFPAPAPRPVTLPVCWAVGHACRWAVAGTLRSAGGQPLVTPSPDLGCHQRQADHSRPNANLLRAKPNSLTPPQPALWLRRPSALGAGDTGTTGASPRAWASAEGVVRCGQAPKEAGAEGRWPQRRVASSRDQHLRVGPPRPASWANVPPALTTAPSSRAEPPHPVRWMSGPRPEPRAEDSRRRLKVGIQDAGKRAGAPCRPAPPRPRRHPCCTHNPPRPPFPSSASCDSQCSHQTGAKLCGAWLAPPSGLSLPLPGGSHIHQVWSRDVSLLEDHKHSLAPSRQHGAWISTADSPSSAVTTGPIDRVGVESLLALPIPLAFREARVQPLGEEEGGAVGSTGLGSRHRWVGLGRGNRP